jgi:LysR family glycine cleavage system transcriptional activator
MADLPPMNWIRSFEVAGRHLNLSHAATELGVTHGAISRQVSQLEKWLDQPLFMRSPGGLTLTRQGEQLFGHIQQGFSHIKLGLEEISTSQERDHITLTVLPSFAIHWLVQRLSNFQARHPDFDIRLLTTRRLVDLMNEDVDLGLRYGLGTWPSLESELLLTDELHLAASPSLAGKIDPTDPRQLRDTLIMSDKLDEGNWQRWFDKAGLKFPDITDRPLYDDTGIAVQAALKGQGVILGRSSLIELDLAEGRLIELSPITVPSPYAMYIIYPPGSRAKPMIAAVCDWLQSEVATPGN